MKKTVLILIDWYLPGRKAGGPVKSIESLVWAMKDEFNFRILTTDTDLGEDQPYTQVKNEQWQLRDDGSEVYYLRKKELSKEKIAAVINATPHDVLYINSFYSKWFSIVPLQLKKKGIISSRIVLAPRGMLSKGALALKSFKKKVYIKLSKLAGLHKGITWHATYEQEVSEIRNIYGNDVRVKLCPNFSRPLLQSGQAKSKQERELKLFFLSRVARVKNLHIALLALKDFPHEMNSNISYTIFGAVEDEKYKEECMKIIAGFPGNIRVEFRGEIKNEEIPAALADQHFLFLPTSNENFGHSIFESLQCGCPVIISNRTPWRHLEQKGCGWDLEPVPGKYVPALKQCYLMTEKEYRIMSEKALELAAEKLHVPEHKTAAIQLFS